MAAGMVVVGTTTGGTAEILVDGQTGLTFPVEDAACLAEKILTIANDPVRWEAIIETAAPLVQREFSIERMIDEIEEEIITVSENDGVLLSR
jgi:glycosyltransferase involved in cell wall biosynthesis